MRQSIYQVKLVDDSILEIWGDMVCLSRSYPFKFFKGCLPQILLGLFLNTVSQMLARYVVFLFQFSFSDLGIAAKFLF